MIKRILNWFQAVKPNPTATDVMVQVGCHFEEVAEMCEALYMDETDTVLQGEADWFKHQKDSNDNAQTVSDFSKLELLDALCDQITTAVGVAYMMGMDIEGALAEVCRSNESKFANGKPIFDANGKIAKGKDYTAPDLARFIGGKE